MSSLWTALLPTAMVGTDRQPSPMPVWPGDMGRLVAQATEEGEPPANALRAAAVLAVCSLAGAQGQRWTAPLPAAAAEDTLPALSDPSLLRLIGWAFSEGPARLHAAICLGLARAGHRLPDTLLPQALELGRRSLAFRPALVEVLGERGLWLAAQRDDWRYAAGVSAAETQDARWTDGTIEQRRAFLSAERAADPAAARERLSAVLGELPAKERAELAGALAVSLGPDDEPLLDQLRNDRSREVRQVALGLLLRLPEAQHPRRAGERLAQLMRHERVLLRKRWQIDAPTEAAADWKSDQLDAARPTHESLGERAWWLYQLVRQVPLGWWTTHTGLQAAELVEWAGGTDWAEALFRAWRDVLFAAPDVAWCEALLDAWPQKLLRDDPSTVLALLPTERRERYWRQQLQTGSIDLAHLVSRMLAACAVDDTLSVELSHEVARAVRLRAEPGALNTGALRQDWHLLQQLPDLGAVLHVDALAPLADLPRPPDETPSYANHVHALTQVVALRRALHLFVSANTP
ncbi:DUF5691 domain-containing protein [Ideonella sp. DXS29W]|uniref:DUF5691 domain-containing protein n=1 Tax=Ideonella lacteola TaxID=2984193 RepID=A0ABU9BN88_9BURK